MEALKKAGRKSKTDNLPIEKASAIGLKDLVRQIQNELVESERERRKEGLQPLLKVHSLDIEAHFVLRTKRRAHGGIDLRLVTLGGSADISREYVHTIRLHLEVADLAPEFTAPEGAFPRQIRESEGETLS